MIVFKRLRRRMLVSKALRFMEKRISVRMNHIWTPDKIVKSPFNDITIPEMTVSEYIWRNLDKWPAKTALICGVTGSSYTYLQLYKKSQTFGASLRKKFKIKDGDVVVIMLPNSPEYLIVVLGVIAAGGLVTTVNPLYTVYETQKQIETSEAKLVVTVPENVMLVRKALTLNKLHIPVIAVDVENQQYTDSVSYKELVDNSNVDRNILKEVKRNPQDTALLLYSSGTTGLPKAVELTNRNIVANFEQQNKRMVKKFNDTTETNQDIALAYLPMFHCYGLAVVCLHKLSCGLQLVTLPKFTPHTFLKALENHEINLAYMAPPTVLFLALNPEVKSKHFVKLKHVAVGGAPLPFADIDKFKSKIGHEIDFGQCYGMTEAGPMVAVQKNDCNNYSVVGYPLPNIQLRIVDNQMNNLGPNKMGELLIKGPNVMKGYKNDPEINAEVLSGGWLKSGDLAKIDVDGSITIADRLKELIKVNAYQVPPAELESIIREHPAVFDAAVIGIPDKNTGEMPKAFVVLNKDVYSSKKDVMDYVNERVAPYKRIKYVQFLNDIPKNASGKILRRVIKEKYVKN